MRKQTLFSALGLVFLSARCLAVVSPLTLTPAPEGTPSMERDPQLNSTLHQAIVTGDWVKVENTLESHWAKDDIAARDAALLILRTASGANRIVGLGVLARHATPADLGSLARTLKGVNWVDERRILVRAIGTRAAALASEAKEPDIAARFTQDGYNAAKLFLDDEDLQIQAAACYSLADLGLGKAAGDFVNRITMVPARDFKPRPGTQLIVQMALSGAAYTLSGVRPETSTDYAQWFRKTGGLTRTTIKYSVETTINNQPVVRSDNLDVYYYFGNERHPPKTGWLASQAIVDSTNAATKAAKTALAPIVGTAHMPVVRLLLCDKTAYGSKASNPSFPGVTQNNEIIVRADTSSSVGSTLTHEYVHMIHHSLFADQPRWLSEGLATSIERSGSSRSSPPGRPTNPDAQAMINRGVFREAISWSTAPSSDKLESVRYANARLAIDFLRFGGFAAPNERLNVLMGKISRGVAHQRALEETYGLTLQALDDKLRKWLEQR